MWDANSAAGITGLEAGFRRNGVVYASLTKANADACRATCNADAACNSFRSLGQLLLDSRLSRRFSWKDIARICLGVSDDDGSAELDREAARLRKRFQLMRDRLREMAAAQGLLSGSGDT
ncbi:MAG TPA: hypothetical protein VF331_23795 [Polyangiales bacterium]